MGISLGGLGVTGIGSFLNNLTGATSAAQQSQKYALQSAQINNIYQKQFAKNAHQWEVEDLQKAGLNPLLSAGGSGASASGGGVASATETATGISPMDLLTAGVGTVNAIHTGKQIQSQTEQTDAQTLYTKAQTQMTLLEFAIKQKMAPDIIQKLKKDVEFTGEQIKKLQTGTASEILGTTNASEALDKAKKGIIGAGKALGNKLTEWTS